MDNDFSRLKSFIRSNSQAEILINILKQSKTPLSTLQLALMTGISVSKIDDALTLSQKYKLCRRVTARKVGYWRYINDGEVKK